MSQASDRWYVRLPDGRVVRASSTTAVRHHMRRGRIPLDSRVRRSSEDEWATLQWAPDFADLYARLTQEAEPVSADREAAVPAVPRISGIAARLDPHQLQTVGIRGAVEELLAALDSTMVRVKLRVAGIVGLLVGAAAAIMYLVATDPQSEAPWWSWLLFGAVLIVLNSLCQAVLIPMTYAEVSHLRPARWQDGVAALPGTLGNLILANGVIYGPVCLGLVLLRQWPVQFPDWYRLRFEPGNLTFFQDLVGLTAFLGELLLWPILSFGLLLAPIIVVENCSAIAALWQWLRLLGKYLGQVFLYQAVAISMGVMVTLPLVLTLGLAAWGALGGEAVDKILRGVLCILGSVALTPLVAYLFVANLFVYLHVRYEQRNS